MQQRLRTLPSSRGPVDILVNNVGIFSVKPFEDLTDEDWMRYFDINVMSAVRMSRIILPSKCSSAAADRSSTWPAKPV
jgi:NAD(P)-dependent dehydrogenase (short-subunit alcohol dehydrogenase family)